MASQSSTDDIDDTSQSALLQTLPSDIPRAAVVDVITIRNPGYSLLGVRVVILTVSMLFSMGASPATSVLSQYLIHRFSIEQNLTASTSNSSQCYGEQNHSALTAADELQAKVSTLIMYYTYSASVPGMVFGLIIGAYSDFLGRRLTLLLPLFGMSLKYALVAFIMRFNLDLWLIYIGFAVEGLTGTGFVALLALYTITADTNAGKKDRILWITIVTAVGNITSAASSVISGIIIKEFGFFPASALLMSTITLCFLIPLLFLAETKPHQEIHVLNLSKNVRRVFGFFLFDGTLRLKLTFTVLLVMFFFAVINDLGVGTIDTLYQLHRPFCWSSKMIGYYGALKTGGANLAAMFLMMGLQYCMKIEHIGLLATVSQAASYCFEAFVKSSWQFFLVPVVGIPGCLITPVIRGMMSLLAGTRNQGALFTSICLFEVACYMAASTVFNKVYAITIGTFAGTVYLCMAAFSCLTFILIIIYMKIHKELHKPEYEKVINADDDDRAVCDERSRLINSK